MSGLGKALSTVRYEHLIRKKKELRDLYDVITKYAPQIETDYEGSVKRLGDTVSIRPRYIKWGEWKDWEALTVDKKLPIENPIQYLMNQIDWTSGGNIVIVYNEKLDRFLYGYTKKRN